MTDLAGLDYLVGASSHRAPDDIREQRAAIRLMCRYIADDAKIARHHAVSIDTVRNVRASIAGQKRAKGRQVRIGEANDSFATNRAFDAMIREGSQRLLEAIVAARGPQRMVG